jgi:hypothetical protein
MPRWISVTRSWRRCQRIALDHGLVERAVADREHDGAMNMRHHHLDECETARRISDPAVAAWSRRRRRHPRCSPASDGSPFVTPARIVRFAAPAWCHAVGAAMASALRRALPTKPVTVVVHVSLSVSLPLDFAFRFVLRTAFSGSRGLIDGFTRGRTRTSTRNSPSPRHLGDSCSHCQRMPPISALPVRLPLSASAARCGFR